MFYAFRHGETDLNRQGIVQGGGTDVPLNALGVEQARALADRLDGVDFIAIYSSDMLRARQTTGIVNERLGLDVFYTALLRETHYGVLEGMAEAVVREHPDFAGIAQAAADVTNPRRFDVCYPEAESRTVAVRRVLRCLRMICCRNGQNVLVSAHGGILRSMACMYGGPDVKIPNCGGLRFDLDDAGLPVGMELF